MPYRSTTLWRTLALLAAASTVALAVGACGGGGSREADISHGRAIFANGIDGNQACSYCHTLRAAGAAGNFAPDLDQDIGEDGTSGWSEQRIDKEVRGLVDNGVCLDPKDPSRCMPKGLASGDDAQDVAAFVAHCASRPGAAGCSEPAPADAAAAKGRELFRSLRCQGCHSTDGNVAIAPTLEGVAGSDVKLADGSKTTADDSYLLTSILVPDAQIVDGYKPGFMSAVIRPRAVSVAQARAIIAYIKTLK